MGKLKGQICYLSGSMESAADGGVEWRRLIAPKLQSLGIGVIDPTNKPEDGNTESMETRAVINKSKAEGQYDKVKETYKELVHVDLRYTDLASFLIVYLDLSQILCGSYDELFMAANQQKPVVIVCPQGKGCIPNWLFGRLKHELFFSTFDEAMVYLERLNDGLEPSLDRWVFLNYDKVFGVEARRLK